MTLIWKIVQSSAKAQIAANLLEKTLQQFRAKGKVFPPDYQGRLNVC